MRQCVLTSWRCHSQKEVLSAGICSTVTVERLGTLVICPSRVAFIITYSPHFLEQQNKVVRLLVVFRVLRLLASVNVEGMRNSPPNQYPARQIPGPAAASPQSSQNSSVQHRY